VQDSRCRVSQVVGRLGTVKPQRDRATLPTGRVYVGSQSPLRQERNPLGQVHSKIACEWPACRVKCRDMDSRQSTGEVAAYLGTSRSRVHRAVAAGLVRPATTGGGHLRFTSKEVAVLQRRLGKTSRLPGLGREDELVLAALGRHPLGLRSVRAVARAAGISPTAAGRVLDRLQRAGLVKRQRRRVVLGRVGEVEVWRVDVAHPRWSRLSPALAGVVLPEQPVGDGSDRKVPRWLRHLFWNVDVDRLEVERDGGFIAGRVLASEDAQAHAWAATALRPEAFLAAASVRGVDPRRAALARNLAASSGS